MSIRSDGGGYHAPTKSTGNLWEAIRNNSFIWNNRQTTPQGAAQAFFSDDSGGGSVQGIDYTPSSSGSYSSSSSQSYDVPSTSPLNVPMPSQQVSHNVASAPVSITSSAPIGTAASQGMNVTTEPINVDTVNESVLKPIGIDLQRTSGLDAWEKNAADKQKREVRVVNMFGEPYDDEDNPGTWFDNQLGLVGNNPVNDTYARFFAEQGMPEDDVYAITHKPQSITEEQQLNESRKLSPGIYDGTTEMLDDGTYNNYWKLTADAMTGTQYKRYRDELGMGGREDIDPTQVYSKRREEVDYGFKPFTPDVSTYLNQATRNVVDVPARIGDAIGSLRDTITPDYDISYDSKEGRKTLSGKEFDKKAPAFMNSFYHDRQFNPEKYMSAPTDGSEYTTLVNQFKVPDVNGNDTYHYGHLVDVSGTPEGNARFSFSDGSSVDTSQDFLNSVYDGKKVNITPEVVPLQAAGSIVDLSSMGPDKHQAMIDEYVIPNEFGEDTYHYHAGGVDEQGNPLPPFSVENGPNGTFRFTFSDGSVVDAPQSFFEQIYDPTTRNVDVPHERIWIEDNKGGLDINYDNKQDLENADVKYLPDMVMSDGTKVSLDDVERLYMDQSPDNDDERKDKNGKPMLSDDDIGYQFRGPLGLPIIDNLINNRPARLGGQEIFKDDDLIPDDLSNLGNNAVDWTLGSIPISVPGILPWIFSASKAARALDSGIDPNSYESSTDSYGLTAGGYDSKGNLKYGVFDEDESGNKVRNDKKSKDVRMSSALGNLAVPFTEQIVGPIGESVIPLEKIANKIPMKSAVGKFLRNEIVGAGGEGVEEVLGNIFDEGTQYGPDMFADPVMDKSTNEPIKDQYGHEKRDESTPIWKRMNNFLTNTAENANSFAGGMLVDANMRLLPAPIGGAIGDFRMARKQDKARRLTGIPEYINPDEVENVGSNKGYARLIDEDELAVSGR